MPLADRLLWKMLSVVAAIRLFGVQRKNSDKIWWGESAFLTKQLSR